MGTILAATDGSPAASAALDCALELAATTGDQLVVVTVWRALQGDFGLAHPSGALLQEVLAAERRHAELVLSEAEALAHRAGIDAETLLVAGDPAERIAALAQEHQARLVAVGTRGHGPLVSLLVGSVSGSVIDRAPCPVLVVGDPGREGRRRPAGAIAVHG